MIKKLLIAAGLMKAPSPVRRILGVNALFGTIPAIAYVGWHYRDRIMDLFHHARANQVGAEATT